MNGIKVAGTSASVSALDFCSDTLTLAIGNECGLVRVKILSAFFECGQDSMFRACLHF